MLLVEFNHVLLEAFCEVLVLQFGINPRFNGNALKELAPKLLVFQFFLGEPMQHFHVHAMGVGKEKPLSLWMEGSHRVRCIINHKVFLGQAVREVVPKEWEDIVFRMDLGE